MRTNSPLGILDAPQLEVEACPQIARDGRGTGRRAPRRPRWRDRSGRGRRRWRRGSTRAGRATPRVIASAQRVADCRSAVTTASRSSVSALSVSRSGRTARARSRAASGHGRGILVTALGEQPHALAEPGDRPARWARCHISPQRAKNQAIARVCCVIGWSCCFSSSSSIHDPHLGEEARDPPVDEAGSTRSRAASSSRSV